MARPRTGQRRTWRFRLDETTALEVSTPPRTTEKQVRRRGRVSVVLGTLIAAVALVAVAYADNVVNDVTVGGTDTFTAGGSTTVNYWIVATGGDGQAGCNASDGSAATVAINVPAGVTATPSSRVFTACGTGAAQSVVFSSPTPGDYAITVSVSDSGSGNYNTTPGGFTLHVLPAPPSDSTPPVITPGVVGTLGDNGWYVSDVTVSWTVVDNESEISSSTGCGPTTIDADTTGTTLTCTATSAGGTASESVTIKRDATPPIVNGAPTTDPNAAGWYNGDVTIQWACSDATSGLTAGCPADSTISDEGEGLTASSGDVYDNAGNSTNATSSPAVNIDKTAPTVSCNAASFILNQPDAQVAATVDDALSGPLNGTEYGDADTSSVGTKDVDITGYDNAGNSTTETCTYTVGYTFVGLNAPVNKPNTMNVSKAGQAIPLKWRLTDYFGDPFTGLTSVIVSVTNVSCSLGDTNDQVEEYASGSSGLQNLGDGYYQFNWKTPTSYASSCKNLHLDLGEGAKRTNLAYFSFKR